MYGWWWSAGKSNVGTFVGDRLAITAERGPTTEDSVFMRLFNIFRPIPVGLISCVTAFVTQSLLVEPYEVAMPW